MIDNQGVPDTSKTDEFMLQIFAIIDNTSVMNFRKKLQHNFPKMRGGGSKVVWNFSENSSVLEGESFPRPKLGQPRQSVQPVQAQGT